MIVFGISESYLLVACEQLLTIYILEIVDVLHHIVASVDLYLLIECRTTFKYKLRCLSCPMDTFTVVSNTGRAGDILGTPWASQK